jgi:hypothetical protein
MFSLAIIVFVTGTNFYVKPKPNRVYPYQGLQGFSIQPPSCQMTRKQGDKVLLQVPFGFCKA